MKVSGNCIYMQCELDEIALMEDKLSKCKRYCKYCHHSVVMTGNSRYKYVICHVCGHAIYINDKEEFKAKLIEAINKIKRQEAQLIR